MVKGYETQKQNSKYFMHEQVDCIDEKNQWLNAEVVEISQDNIKVHFTNYSIKFDVWLNEDSERVQKQWRYGQDFKLNNRIDVLDTYNQWKEARIIGLNETQIFVHYKGYSPKYEEWIHNTSSRIKEIGSKSTAHGVGRLDPSNSLRHSKKEAQLEIHKKEYTNVKEKRFCDLLHEKSLVIHPVEGDGNCLFRSVSHQLYGSTSFYDIIRQYTMKYISIERDYFSQFIVGGLEKTDEYLEQQSRNGAWGDEIEIQAMSEIYNKPFEIYAYSNTPMKTFHENSGLGRPLMLAYHGQSHYNSICDKDRHVPILQTTPGEFEESILEKARRGEIKDLIGNCRKEFEEILLIDLEETIRISLEESNMDDATLQTALEDIENSEYMKAISESIGINSEEEMVKYALEMSKKEILPDSVNDVINSGFTMEQAMEALYMVGDNPNQMIEYIFSKILN